MKTGKEEKIGEIIKFLKNIEGIEKVKILSDTEKNELLKIEEKCEKSILMGLMPGINEGVREAISRTFTIAAITNDDFKWPTKGTIRFLYKGEIIGEDVRDQEELLALKNMGNKIIGGMFVLYTEKMNNLGIKNLRNATLVIPPLNLSWNNKVPNADRIIIGSPSPPTDLYIKENIFGEKDVKGKGSILIGFELT
jgi:hypothetical protein